MFLAGRKVSEPEIIRMQVNLKRYRHLAYIEGNPLDISFGP